MNRSKKYPIRNMAVVLLACMGFASCTQDELTEQGTALPDGAYPLTFTAVQTAPTDAPQTRVSENPDGESSTWREGDKIKVTVSDNGNKMETTCTLDASGNITEYDPQLYWQNTKSATINAWYSNIAKQQEATATNTVSLADQSKGLAYVLKAEELTANYQTTSEEMKLKFHHQLAKVRVKLEGEKAEDVKSVQVKGHTSCTVTDGDVKGSGNGYITMRQNGEYYEANLVPSAITANDFIRLNDEVQATIDGTITRLEAGHMYTFTIDVKPAGPSVITGGETIDKPGDYIMAGNITSSVTLNAEGINLTLDNVQAKTNDAPLIIGNNAQVTLNISGTANSLTSTNGNGIEIKEGASLTITGNGKNSSKLVVKASDNTNPNMELRAGIGPSTGNVSIKTININNVHLVVSGGRTGNNGNGPAAIGLCSVNGTYNQSCEGISITDSKIEATSYGGACIGTGSVSNDIYTGGTYNLGLIDIRNSEITATANGGAWSDCGSCIGFGYIGADASGVIKGITITNTTLNLTVMNSSAYKVGRGNKINNASYNITDGIIFNGQNKGSEGWNP